MTPALPGPQFRIHEIPFSHFGSWLSFSPVIAERTYADDIHLISHQGGMHPVLRLAPEVAGRPVAATPTATPSVLRWEHEAGYIEAAYESPDTVRLRGDGLGLRLVAARPTLTPFSGPYFLPDPTDGSYLFTLYETGRRYRITVLTGTPTEVLAGQQLGTAERGIVLPDGQPWQVAVEEYRSARAPYRQALPFGRIVAAAAGTFAAFVDAVAPWRGVDTPAAELAAYVIWSAGVRPDGFVTRPAILMSKHWMNKVWSWDHCFNALALAPGVPRLAWDQFQLVFDHQDTTGALPDSITHSEVLYNFVKPPIHGWALRQLREALPDLDDSSLTQAYRRLADWTRFWLTTRRVPGHELAHYQHGNDSGWDNATTFDPQRAVESADLTAYLVLQLGELGRLAEHLGLTADVECWADAAAAMRDALLDQLWTGQEFITRAAGPTGEWSGTSLLELMPIVLGDDLPATVRDVLARRIRAHLTPYGLATELPGSPHYQADGYWRGPIWAPATVLIEDGLRRAGCRDLADDISARFRALCEQSGFAENFDAMSGAGLRDRAYTWTAAAYLILAAAAERRRTETPHLPSGTGRSG